ncbi:MAG: hypothetical protein L0332_06190 [Chloroflexi bacterium]|nr:hypothetical protein [Chloroflexota bacterium]MCI0575537.1 hypothetical protein [Chloroflexota bacterium]MCI0644314.1 hypothetical protein [Chloroflexota bacterium]MCI0726297.1 hypothetical protein [Chloroflexota bacterium]
MKRAWPPRALLWLGAAGVVVVMTLYPLFDVALGNVVAVQTLKSAGATSVTDPPVPQGWEGCRTAHATGRYYLLHGEAARAMPTLEKGVTCGGDRWAWFDLGWAQYLTGDLENAAHSWAMAGAYDHAANLARQIAQEGDVEKTVAAWEFAAAVDPEAQAPYVEMARLFLVSDPARAEALLQQAIEVNPNEILAYLELAGFYVTQQQDLEQAHVYYQMALTQAPENIVVLTRLAENAVRLGRTAEAIEHWQQIAALSEERRALAYYTIGNLTLADNNVASALEFFRQAVVIEPANSQYLRGLAQAYVAAGCQEQARATYQRLLGLELTPELWAQIEAELGELASAQQVEGVNCPALP